MARADCKGEVGIAPIVLAALREFTRSQIMA